MRLRSLWVAVLLAGCGPELSAPAEQWETSSAGLDARMPSGLAPRPIADRLPVRIDTDGPFTLPPASCEPRSFTAAPKVAPCVVRHRSAGGTLAREEHFNAANALTLAKELNADGTLRSVQTRRYRSDGQPFREAYEDLDAAANSFTTVWSYDRTGRLQEELKTSASGRTSRIVIDRDAAGRVVAKRYFEQGMLHSLEEFGFTGDRLTSVKRFLLTPQKELSARETWTHHVNGSIAVRTYETIPASSGGISSVSVFDESGRSLSVETTYDDGDWSERWSYQPMVAASYARGTTTNWVTEKWSEYDDAGRTLREVRASTFGMEDQPSVVRTRRLTHACERGELLLEELDTDGSGWPDGWRRLTYDEAGRLIADEATGTATSFTRYARTDYDYSCR